MLTGIHGSESRQEVRPRDRFFLAGRPLRFAYLLSPFAVSSWLLIVTLLLSFRNMCYVVYVVSLASKSFLRQYSPSKSFRSFELSEVLCKVHAK